MTATPPVLAIDALSVGFAVPGGRVQALRDVSLAIQPGEAYGLIGESGSGKSTLALAVMRYLGNGTVEHGTIRLEGADVLALPEAGLAALRGNRVAMVYQDAQAALNPSMRIGDQVAEAVRCHRGGSWRAARAEARTLLAQVNLPDPATLARRYPHQVSGGQQQRVVIAMALACRPALLIMDEPTTGLDVTTEAVILDLIVALRQQFGTAILFISHNIAVVSQVCDRVGVLYAGRLVEEGTVAQLLAAPAHPYTRGLLDCLPQPDAARARLAPIAGTLPDLRAPPAGCIFAARCRFAEPRCTDADPPLRVGDDGRRHLCHFDLVLSAAAPAEAAAARAVLPTVRLQARGLRKAYYTPLTR
jgi:peptide/nickel transport system ATP-binding protein